MIGRRPRAARRLAALLALLLALCVHTVARAGNRIISAVVVDEDAITIRVPIAVVGGDDLLIAQWRHGIDRAWNYGNAGRPFRVCGREVRFDAQFISEPSAPAYRPSHVVIVESVRPGQRYVSTVWHALGTSPSYSRRIGYWGSNTSATTAAHEFGHLLGLLDEYAENDANGNGIRDDDERPVPDLARHPDADLSLMASENGRILERHIREVLRMHGATAVLGCQATF